MKPSRRTPVLVLSVLSAFSGTLSATDIPKAANTDALNLGTSWVGGTAPASGDVAVWDATVAAANPTNLGANLSWQGVRVTSPGGAVTLNNTANTLTLGSSGLDLSAATQNLTIGTSLVSDAAQTWSLASGRTLNLWTVNTARGLSGSSSIAVSGPVTGSATVAMLPGANGSTGFNDATSNSGFSGNWTINPNVIVQNIRNGATAWGTGSLTLAGGTIAQFQGNWTWTNPITLATATTSTIDDKNTSQNRTLKLQGVLSGDGNLVIAETGGGAHVVDGGVILTAANTLSGTVTVNSGSVLRVGGIPGDSTVTTVGASGTLGTASAIVNGTLTLSRDNTWTFANQVSGTGLLRVGLNTGSATHIVTVSGDNSHAGGTTLQTAVTVKLGHANALGSGPFTIAGNGVFDNATGSSLSLPNALTLSGGSPTFTGTNDLAFSGPVTVSTANRTLTVNAGNLTLSGAISQDVAGRNLTKQGAGSLTLGGVNSLSGNMIVSAGTLTVSGTSTTAGATLNAGTLVLDYGVSDTSKIGDSSVLTLAGGSLVIAGETGSHTEVVGSTVLSGTTTLSRTGANTVKIALGAITRNAGATLSIPGENFATTTTANVNGILPGITIGGTGLAANDGLGNIVAATSGLTEVTRLESGAKTITSDTAANIRIVDGTGSSPADLTLAAPGTTDIANLSNGATGGPSILDLGSGNTLRLGAFAFLSSEVGSAAFTVANGTLTAGGADNTAGDIILANTGSAETTVSSTISNNGTGAVSLTKNGSGPFTLSGSNSFTGNVIVNTGSLTLSGGSALADTVNVSLANTAGATLVLNSSETLGGLSGGGTTGGIVNLNGQSLTVTPPAAHSNFTGAITGSGILVKAGANQLRLGGTTGAGTASSSFSALQIDAGLLVVTSPAAVTGVPSVSLNGDANTGLVLGDVFAGGTLNIGAFSGTGGKVRVDWNNPTGQRTLSVTQSTDTSFAGIFEDAATGSRSVGLAKNGSGSLTLSGLSTSTGSFTVNAGSLVAASATAFGTGPVNVNGGTLNLGGQTLANTVTIGSSGTLTGSGTLFAPITSNGSITPGGSSIGLVSLGASPTLSSSSQLAFQLASAGGVRGTDHDALNVTGSLALDGTVTVSLAGLTPAAGQQFDLINATGTLDLASFNLATDLVLPALAPSLAWDTSEFASDGIVSIVTASFATWQADKFTAPELADPLISGDDADPDGDGLTNALEYAFGSEPKSGDSGSYLPQASTATGALVLNYLRPVNGAPGVTYVVESHTELVSGGTGWSTATPVTDYVQTTSTAGVPPGYERVTVTFNTAVPSGQKRFGRILVSF